MRTRSLRPLAAAAAIVALIGAGCSDTPAETGGGPDTKRTAAPDKTAKFADCMREHGVKAFPDSNTSSDQELVEAIKEASSSPAWKQALSACKDLRPAGLLGGTASPKEMSARLKFAQCMRDNGVKDFPDPVKDGPLIDTNRIPSAAGRGALDIPGFKAAADKCGDLMADALDGR